MSVAVNKSNEQPTIIVERILVVEDDMRLSTALAGSLEPHAKEVRICNTEHDAFQMITSWRPQLVVLDFKLKDGDAIHLLSTISECSPFPKIIAMSAYAQPIDAFHLAQYGVRVFLQKPIDLHQLEAALSQALDETPNLVPLIRGAVGHVGIKHLEQSVRRTMMEEALSRTNGSRRGAAKILQVSRQFVQHVINKINQ